MGESHHQDGGPDTSFDSVARRPRRGKLEVLSGPSRGLTIQVSGARLSGGRGSMNDLVIEDDAVSETHFEIVARDDGYRLRDTSSRTGTFVSDLRIHDVRLRPGTVFSAGHTRIRFQLLPEVPEIADPGPGSGARFEGIIGASAGMQEIFARLEKVALSDLTCLITGETGTGKELVARAIHRASPRKDRPFVVLDCGAIPRELIESTLFGHEKGSFTGAIGQHRGCFEQADGGTIFLDEIGELDISLQPKLLRVLEQREVKRVGGARTISVDVRVLAATNRDLGAEVSAGHFREDLYFRLSVMHLEIPPLRQRREDIPVMAQRFLDELGARRGVAMTFDQGALDALIAHSWPGNVRELRNVVERASALCDGPVIMRSDLIFGSEPGTSPDHALDPERAAHPEGRPEGRVERASARPVDETSQGPVMFAPTLFEAGRPFKEAKQIVVDAFEAAYLKALVERHKGNITRSAEEAGLTRYHLRELLKRHQLAPR